MTIIKLAISDVLSGLMAFAKHALRDGTSMKIMSAFPLVTSVPPGMKPVALVKPATMDLS
mgnify:CR=1 FL=1